MNKTDSHNRVKVPEGTLRDPQHGNKIACMEKQTKNNKKFQLFTSKDLPWAWPCFSQQNLLDSLLPLFLSAKGRLCLLPLHEPSPCGRHSQRGWETAGGTAGTRVASDCC
jgi:hypothetical protein